jgi:Carboxypeptidase regulatory-like domain
MRTGKSVCRDARIMGWQKSWVVLVLVASLFCRSSSVLADDPAGLKPVTVRVVDEVTLLPITNFTFSCWIETPTSPRTLKGESIPVVSRDGHFEIPAPASCKITIEALAPDFIPGYNNYKDFAVRSDDLGRQIEVRLRRGFQLRGTVRDKRTKLPVAEAIVAPLIFTPPLWTPDEKREVRTDGQGRFHVRGVDVSGVQISHSNYATATLAFYERDDKSERQGVTITRDVLLETGNIIKGIVTSPGGRPLENVKVEDYGGKIVLTGKDGRFEIRGALKERDGDDGKSFSLTFSKDGYIDRDLYPKRIPSRGLRVVLEPNFQLKGSVTDSMGNPVTLFTVAAGPGTNPPDFESTKQVVTNSDGAFSIALSNLGTNWVGVRAAGFATWEGWFVASRGGKGMDVRLQSGYKFSGSVNPFRPATFASLVPIRPKPDTLISCKNPAVELGTLQVPVEPSGRFDFQHVRPDHYVLAFSGTFITPTNLEVTIPNSDIALSTLPLAGVGAIKGQAFKSTNRGGEVWAFANGEVRGAEGLILEFKTDENGKFNIENAPTGALTVSILDRQSADVVGRQAVGVSVLEGKTSEVTIGP